MPFKSRTSDSLYCAHLIAQATLATPELCSACVVDNNECTHMIQSIWCGTDRHSVAVNVLIGTVDPVVSHTAVAMVGGPADGTLYLLLFCCAFGGPSIILVCEWTLLFFR